MGEKKHRHKFVPVDVIWFGLWGSMNADKLPKVGYVVSACACGVVKTVKATKLIGARNMLQDYKKWCGKN